MGSTRRVPVCVKVGNSATWLAVNEGPMDVGGQAPYEDTWAAAMVGDATPPVAEAGYVPENYHKYSVGFDVGRR